VLELEEAISAETYSNASERQPKEALSRRHGSAGSKVQHIEQPLSVGLFPIKLALVILRAEFREQTLGFLATVYDGRASAPRRDLGACQIVLLRVAYVPVGGDQDTGQRFWGFPGTENRSYEMSLQLVARLAPPTGNADGVVGTMKFDDT